MCSLQHNQSLKKYSPTNEESGVLLRLKKCAPLSWKEIDSESYVAAESLVRTSYRQMKRRVLSVKANASIKGTANQMYSNFSRYAESSSYSSGKKRARSPARALLRKTTRQLKNKWRALSANLVEEMYAQPNS
jgi:hypothetical protein